MIQFPSYEIANNWSNSEEQKKASELRKKGANTKAVLINGI